MKKTFRGGVHIPEHKNTSGSPLVHFPAGDKVYIPMRQHIGAACAPTVSVGDRVYVGSVIGTPGNALGTNIHSSVSGVVVAIESVNDNMGKPLLTVVIENDKTDEKEPSLASISEKLGKDMYSLSVEELSDAVKDAGVSGLGGATFPTHAKILSAKGKTRTVIVNLAECEPYITVNHRLALESPDSITNGLVLIMRALSAKEGIIAIEDNKRDAARLLEASLSRALSEHGDGLSARVVLLKTKYPQGDERQIIYALKKKELPAGALPSELGCLIFNAETVSAIYRALDTGMPLVRRAVTVDGDCVQRPSNLFVPIGTPIKEILDFCSLVKEPIRLICGGPMMGNARWDINAPVEKGTSAVLVFSYSEKAEEASCIHCGRCVSVCPMRLMPLYIMRAAKDNDLASAERLCADACTECGSCTFVCPAKMPLMQYIRIAKGDVITEKRKRGTR